MKKLLIIIFIFSWVSSNAQSQSGIQWDKYYITGTVDIANGRNWCDSNTLFNVGPDTTTKCVYLARAKSVSSVQGVKKAGMLYYFYDVMRFGYWDGISWQYSGIVSDTAHMLLPYLKKVDSTTLWVTITQQQDSLNDRVPIYRTINNHTLNMDINLSKNDIGLGNVDNTSDINKPISTATQNALIGKINYSDTDTYIASKTALNDSANAIRQAIIDSAANAIKYRDTSTIIITATTLNSILTLFVPKTTTINGYTLNSNIVISKSDVGLSNVDNVNDANKPVSIDAQDSLDKKINKSDSGVIYITPTNLITAIGFIPQDSIGGTISSTPIVGQFITKTSIKNWIDSAFYATQPPTATLTGGTTLEKHSAGTVSKTLSWSASRQAVTAPLASIVVGGVTQTFSQPSQPGTVSGTQSVTLTYNTNATFTNAVTTTDNKTATASTTYTFQNSRYWGYTSTSSPTDANIISISGGGTDLVGSRAKTTFSIIITGSTQFIYYAYPASFGNLTSFVVGGFESIGAFTLITRSFTNASGFAESYNIYVSNNTFSNTTISGMVTN